MSDIIIDMLLYFQVWYKLHIMH